MPAKKSKKRFDSKTKVSILRKHLQKKQAISKLCEEYEVTPATYYQWQEVLFESGHICFEKKLGRPANEKKKDKEIADLKEKLGTKNAVISELMEELLREKKLVGVN